MSILIDENWITTDEAAIYLGVKPSTIRDWIKKNNGIPSHKVGKFWRFKKSELDAWIENNHQNSNVNS